MNRILAHIDNGFLLCRPYKQLDRKTGRFKTVVPEKIKYVHEKSIPTKTGKNLENNW